MTGEYAWLQYWLIVSYPTAQISPVLCSYASEEVLSFSYF
jgi:hypothetical protein